MKKDKKEMKYQIELEVVEIGKQENSKKIMRSAEKNLRKLILSRIEGKMGEC